MNIYIYTYIYIYIYIYVYKVNEIMNRPSLNMEVTLNKTEIKLATTLKKQISQLIEQISLKYLK